MTNPKKHYVSEEIKRIQNTNSALQNEGYTANMVISFSGAKTKNLSVSWEQLEQIKQILTKG